MPQDITTPWLIIRNGASFTAVGSKSEKFVVPLPRVPSLLMPQHQASFFGVSPHTLPLLPVSVVMGAGSGQGIKRNSGFFVLKKLAVPEHPTLPLWVRTHTEFEVTADATGTSQPTPTGTVPSSQLRTQPPSTHCAFPCVMGEQVSHVFGKEMPASSFVPASSFSTGSQSVRVTGSHWNLSMLGQLTNSAANNPIKKREFNVMLRTQTVWLGAIEFRCRVSILA
jgi:hypothetical protein